MTKLILVLLLLMTSFSAFSEQTVVTQDGRTATLYDDGTWRYSELSISPNSGFRKVLWGSSIDQALASESSEPDFQEDSVLVYQTKISGLSCSAVYFYAENRLVRARYFFTEKHSNENDYTDDYSSIKRLLTAKYGESDDTDQIWKNDLYKDDYSHWGMAVATGKMYYYSNWETDDTTVSLQLFGDNFAITHQIDYVSREFGFLEEQARLKEAQDSL